MTSPKRWKPKVKYKIERIHFYDIYGNLLWTERMMFKKLWEVGDEFIYKSKKYSVKRIAVAGKVQIVNVV